MLFCRCTSDALDTLHQVEFVEVESDVIVTANYSKGGDADISGPNIAA
jgi:hypothetical protein